MELVQRRSRPPMDGIIQNPSITSASVHTTLPNVLNTQYATLSQYLKHFEFFEIFTLHYMVHTQNVGHWGPQKVFRLLTVRPKILFCCLTHILRELYQKEYNAQRPFYLSDLTLWVG